MRYVPLLTLCLLLVTTVRATDTQWQGLADGSWFDAANWTNGVPTATGSAGFAPKSPGLVVSLEGGSATVGNLSVSANYDFQQGSLTANSVSIAGYGRVGLNMEGSSAAKAVNLTTGSLFIGEANASYGALSLGQGSHIHVTGVGDSLTLNVMGMLLSGASLSANGNAVIHGSGMGSIQAYQGSTVQIGGNLDVERGYVSLYGDPSLRNSLSVGGDLLVDADGTGSGSLNLSATDAMVGGSLVLGPHAYVTMNQEATLTVGEVDLKGTFLMQDPNSEIHGNVVVESGGLLKGTAKNIAGNVTVKDGGLYAGDDAGVIHIGGDLIETATSRTGFLVLGSAPGTPTGYSQILVGGSASLAGEAHLDLDSAFAYHVGDVLDLVAAGGGLTGTFSELTVNGSGTWALSYDAHHAYATLTAVPEPGSVAALGLGSALVLRRRKRR